MTSTSFQVFSFFFFLAEYYLLQIAVGHLEGVVCTPCTPPLGLPLMSLLYAVNDMKLSSDLNKKIYSLYMLKAAWTLEYTLSFPHSLYCIFCGIMISISQGCCLTGAR